MAILAWIRLLILEQRLGFIFGKYNKYRRLCLEQNARSARERLRIAQEVWSGPQVNVLEAWWNAIVLRQRGIKP
jgi:hypothetical protein